MNRLILTILYCGMSKTAFGADVMQCVDFVKLDDSHAKEIIDAVKADIPELEDSRTFPSKNELAKETKQLADTNMHHFYKCLQLRDINRLDVTSFQRIEGLINLSDMVLTEEEMALFKKSIEQNKQHFNRYSEASIGNEHSCKYPLLYLTGQKNTANGTLIYEQRLVDGSKIQTFYSYLPIDNEKVSFRCSKDSRAQQQYIGFLNDEIGLDLHLNGATKEQSSGLGFLGSEEPTGNTYLRSSASDSGLSHRSIAINGFEAVDYLTAKKIVISKGSDLFFREKKGNEVFFKYNQRKYRVGKIVWEANTE